MIHDSKKRILGCAVGLLFASSASATLINFDDLASGTPLTNQYSSQGVTFTGFEDAVQIAPEVRSQQFLSTPASSPNYLTNFFQFPSTSNLNRLDEIRITFSAPTSGIAFDLNTAGTNTIRFDLFDFGGAFLQSISLAGNDTNNVSHVLAGTNIGRISAFQPTDVWWWSLDNLRFTQQTVSEPLSLALFGIGLAGLAAARRRKN